MTTEANPGATADRPDTVVRRPDEPGHWMRVRPLAGRVEVLVGDRQLANSERVLAVTEVSSRGVLDTVLYLPRDDVDDTLALLRDATSHCPLKGDARYYSLDDDARIAWEYAAPPDFAAVIAGHVAFYTDRVKLVRTGPQHRD